MALRIFSGSFRSNPNIKFYSSTATNTIQTADVTKQTLLQKCTSFWKALLRDYRDAITDSSKHAKEHPLKSGVWMSVCGFCASCALLNPDESSHREQVIKKSNELIFIGKSIRDQNAENYLRDIELFYNREQISRVSFGIFSVMLFKGMHSGSGLYRDNCSYIQPTYYEILQNNIIDIGFWNKWWLLEKKTLDYDINPDEWSNENKVK